MTLQKKRFLKTAALVSLALVVLLSTLSYIYYPDLKKIFIAKVSEEVSSFIGQRVEIRDFSFNPSAGMNVYNIRVLNPKGFDSGPLLKIKRLYLKLNFRALLGQEFYFKEITVHEPELTLVRNTKGRLNISEKLLHLFEKKSAHQYRIDEFNIMKGAFGLNGEDKYSIRNVILHLKPLASGKGVKTSAEGSATYYGSRLDLNGWVYLKEEPKRLNVSVSSGNLSPVPLRTFLSKYGINPSRTKVAGSLNAEGDTEKGFRLRSEIIIDRPGFPKVKTEVKEISLGARAFLDIPENSLSVDSLSLRADGITAATASGKIMARRGNFFYDGSVKVKRIDLSSFNLVKNFRVSGNVTSGFIRFSGDSKAPTPKMSGTLQVYGAAFRSKYGHINKIQARIRFSSEKEMKVEAEGTGHFSKLYGYPFEKPGNMNIVLTGRKSRKGISMTASINVSPIETHLKEGGIVRFKGVSFKADGFVKGGDISGKAGIEIKGMDFDTYGAPWLKAGAYFGYSGNAITARDASIEAEDFKVSAGAITVRLPVKGDGNEIGADFKNIDASYFPEEAAVGKTDISARVKKGGGSLSGVFGFSTSSATFRGVHAGSIAGRGTFDGKDFKADISGVGISGGKLGLSARGKTIGGPFPLIIDSTAEGIDLAVLSKETSDIVTIPYDISGYLKKASFAGTVLSARSLQGNGELDAEKVSLRRKSGRRNILKDCSLAAKAEFAKEDMNLKAEAKTGKVIANISGRIKGFLKQDKSFDMKFKLPPAKATDIRDSFWDIFPDSLLYSGLDGSLSSDLEISYSKKDFSVQGKLTFDELELQGENGEYEIGPVNGTLPIAYTGKAGDRDLMELPSFEPSEFESLSGYYARMSGRGYSRISVGSLKYGFKILDNLDIWIAQRGTALNIKRFSGNISGGKLNGSAAIDLSKGVSYRAGFLLEGLSLKRLCDEIEPIKGYISGKLNGIGLFVGSKAGLPNLTGRLDFWSYGSKDEKTIISKEFLKRIGGPSLKKYLGDRPFDKGIMDLYLRNGFVIFKNLEISHRNFFGMTDLSIKVAPYSNRIAIERLMWSVTEAAQRAKNK
jgi:hypothetical protein